MKVWMFYIVPVYETSIPMLYGFTKDPDIAHEFATIRKGLAMLEKKMTTQEYNELAARCGDAYDIVLMDMITQVNGIKTTVKSYVTAAEMLDFSINRDTIITNYLGTRAQNIPWEIFSDEIQEFLNEIGFIETARLAVDVPINGMAIPWERTEDTGSAKLWSGKYDIDELALFYKWREYTIVGKGERK